MRIGDRAVAPAQPPYIIAEIGVNHDGSPDLALDLTRAAAEAGADAIKLQLFRADLLLSRASRLADYQAAAGERDPLGMLARLELTPAAMAPIAQLAHDLGLHAIVTVFSLELVEPARRLRWDAFKTASPDIVNDPLLDALAADGRPLIVSTGAAEAAEVHRAIARLSPRANGGLALLQCVSSYPTPPHLASIGGMIDLARDFAGPIGYSDHTEGLDTGAIAVRCGASILEKHLTYSRAARGPDHAASLEPAGFAEYVRRARAARTRTVRPGPPPLDAPEVGPIRKRVLDVEREVRSVSRQSITTVRSLPHGHTLTRADLTLKRPGTGIEPSRLASLLGRRLARSVEADVPLAEPDLLPERTLAGTNP